MNQTTTISRRKAAAIILGLATIIFAGILLQQNKPTMKPNPAMTVQTTKDTNEVNLLSGQWSFMPGMKKATNGYAIEPKDFTIVEQDGSVAQVNPPINLAGTHVASVTGEFAINAQLKTPNNATAIIQLYGQPPVIADEFRVERESLQLQIAKNTLTVKQWNGKTQTPSVRVFQFDSSDVINLKIARQDNLINFVINEKQIGSLNESGLFAKGQIWFGFDGKGKWLLSKLTITNLSGQKLQIADASTIQITKHDVDGMQKLAAKKRPDFIVGGAMALGPLTSDPAFAQIALDKNIFGSMTPENGMKMINLQPQRGVYTFEQADALVKLAKQNGLTVHGHTLVFGEANPPWLTLLPTQTSADKQAIKQIMIDHITTVVKHFGNDVQSWDVINEPLADYDEFEQGQIMRNHKWFQAMGNDYIITALETAHKANPNATLFINEYGLEEDGERWEVFITLLKTLKPQLDARGIPTNKIGVGFQTHVYESSDRVDVETLKRHIKQLEQLGFKSQVSEMDVYSDDGDLVQADQYAKVFTACLSEKNCLAWRTWIISDKYDYWKDDNGNIQTGIDGLFDSTMKPRPGYSAILNSLK